MYIWKKLVDADLNVSSIKIKKFREVENLCTYTGSHSITITSSLKSV
jgi:hypothetical protein